MGKEKCEGSFATNEALHGVVGMCQKQNNRHSVCVEVILKIREGERRPWNGNNKDEPSNHQPVHIDKLCVYST
jgi:hypothetical protein